MLWSSLSLPRESYLCPRCSSVPVILRRIYPVRIAQSCEQSDEADMGSRLPTPHVTETYALLVVARRTALPETSCSAGRLGISTDRLSQTVSSQVALASRPSRASSNASSSGSSYSGTSFSAPE